MGIEPEIIVPVPSLPNLVTNDDNEDVREEESTTISSTEVNRIFIAEASTESVTAPIITTTTTTTTTTTAAAITATTTVPETQPTTELRQITFKIIDDDGEDEGIIDPEITFTLVDPTELPDLIPADT